MTAPRYQEVKAAEIPEVTDDDGTHVRMVCGNFWGKKGPVEGVAADPRLPRRFGPAGRRKTFPLRRRATPSPMSSRATDNSAMRRNRSASRPRSSRLVERRCSPSDGGDRSLVLFDSGDEVTVQAGDNGIRFLLVSGKPIEEPVAWYGPIVMNTQDELEQAVSELRNGTFIRN